MVLKHPKAHTRPGHALTIGPLFGREPETIPRHYLPEGEMPPEVALQIIRDELMLDGNARLNLATFVTTWAEPQAELLMAVCQDKNMIDKDEYPNTAELEVRCVNMLSRLWHAPDADQATGCSTTGSSEAAMLGGLALKRRWQKARAAAGLPADRPNIVMGINVQVCWEKFANYWDVEMRLIPMEGDRYHLSADEAVKACDENTIGVVAVLGSTFDGSYEPVAESARRWTRSRPIPASMSRFTWTARRAPSWPRSSTLTSNGTSGFPAWPRSTRDCRDDSACFQA
jgi:glutamate decarboxylase